MKPYEQELVNFIEENRMKYYTTELVVLIKEKFGKSMSAKTLRKYYCRHDLDYKRMYKRNYKNTISRKVGTESNPDKNGLVRIKVNNRQWQYKQRYLYEKYNGQIPDGYVIIFADGDKNNFKRNNLIAVPEKVARTFYAITKGEYKDKKLTKTGLKIAEVISKVSEIKEEYEKQY